MYSCMLRSPEFEYGVKIKHTGNQLKHKAQRGTADG